MRVVDEQKYDSGSATAFISPRSAFGALIQFWHTPNWEQAHPKPAPDGLAYFDHVSLAVKDIAAAYKFFTTLLSRARKSATRFTPAIPKATSTSAISRSPASSLNSSRARAHKPDNDFVGKFIARYGEGMHHVSIDLKDFDETRERLKRDGVRVVDEKRNWRGERQYFISPQSAFGVLIQIWDGLQ